jgi:hypothetical protein
MKALMKIFIQLGLFVLAFFLQFNLSWAQTTVTFPANGTDQSTSNTQGTWTVPAGVTSVVIEVWGSGGGGVGRISSSYAGSGGGGGAYARKTYTVSPGDVLYYQYGGQGQGATPGSNKSAGNGNTSYVKTGSHAGTVVASAGGGNGGTNGTTGGTGGAGSSTYSCSGGCDDFWYGGTGGAAGCSRGGGGGGGAGSGLDGGNGVGYSSCTGAGGSGGTAWGSSLSGGNGGSVADASSVSNGNIRGGGGSGGGWNTSATGGNGGGGFIRITYTACSGAPTVASTTAASSITCSTASSGGNISAQGGCSVTARGVCWSTSANPTTANSKTSDGSGTGTFTSSITGLSANTTYYVRAYATNAAGTSYGAQVSFTTGSNPSAPTASAATNANCNSFSANWSSASGATTYFLDVSTVSNFSTFVSGYNALNVGNVTTYSVTGLSAGTVYYYRVRAGSTGCSNSSNSSTITTATSPATPATPGTISGTAAQCAGLIGQIYSVAPVSNATSYSWTVPTGWTITSGNGTRIITVTTGSAGQNGNISVTATNSCGTSAARTLAVTVGANQSITLSSAAGTDNQSPTQNTAITNITYTTSGASGATVTGLPAGVSGSYSGGTVTISGTPTTLGTYSYTVTTSPATCSVSATGVITVVSLIWPGVDCGWATFNPGTGGSPGTDVYEVSINNGSSWSSYIPGSNINTTGATGSIKVRAMRDGGSCADSPYNTYTLWNVGSAPTLSAAPAAVCVGSTPGTISVTLPTGAASVGIQWYINTDNNNTTGTSISGATSTTYQPASISGTVYYYAVINGCYTTSTIAVTVNSPDNTLLSQGDWLWSGAQGTGWQTPGNWLVWDGTYFTVSTVVPSSSNNVRIKQNGTCILNQPIINGTALAPAVAGSNDCKNLTIESAASLTFEAGQTRHLQIFGVYSNEGTMNYNIGRIKFLGTAQSIYDASGTATFYEVRIGSTSITDLASNLTILYEFRLQGVANSNGYILHLTNSAADATSLPLNTGHVNGTLRRTIASNTNTYAFPVGNGTALTTNRYLLEFINNNITGVSYLDCNVASISESGNNIQSRLDVSNKCRELVNGTYSQLSILLNSAEWDLSPNLGATPSGNYGVKLYVANTGLSASDDNKFAVVKRSSSSTDYAEWDAHTNSTAIPIQDSIGRVYNLGIGCAQKTSFTSFSKFAIAKAPFILPIKLSNFEAICDYNTKKISWKTLKENNCNSYVIEGSKDGIEYQAIKQVECENNTKGFSYYYETNDNKNYFKLKQIDFDGKFEYFGPVYANCNSNQVNTIKIFPNPNNGEQINMQLFNKLESDEPYVIYNALGQTIHNGVFNIGQELYQINFDRIKNNSFSFIVNSNTL